MKHGFSRNDVIEAFKSVLVKRFPASAIEEEPAKRLSSNTRIRLPKEATGDTDGNLLVVKLKKYFIARIPRARFEPFLLLTSNSRFLLFGVRLSQHGGHVAVELGRKVAKDHGSKLVVLDRQVLSFDIIDLFTSFAPSDVVKGPDTPSMKLIADGIEKFQAINDDFHERVSKLFT